MPHLFTLFVKNLLHEMQKKINFFSNQNITFSEVLDEDKPEKEENPPDPLDDTLIKTLIEQKSDDEREVNENEIRADDYKKPEPKREEVIEHDHPPEDLPEEIFDEDLSKTESLSISLSKEGEEVTLSDPIGKNLEIIMYTVQWLRSFQRPIFCHF